MIPINEKDKIVASLKWIVFNLGETEKNTFENAIKVYVQNTIDYLEKAIEVKS